MLVAGLNFTSTSPGTYGDPAAPAGENGANGAAADWAYSVKAAPTSAAMAIERNCVLIGVSCPYQGTFRVNGGEGSLTLPVLPPCASSAAKALTVTV